MRWLLVVVVIVAGPAIAQRRVGSVRESPFVPGDARIYDERGDFIGTARENPFIGGRTDLYDATGQPTGIAVEDNPFIPGQRDVFDDGAGDE